MSEQPAATVQQLFQRWRSGDAQAGQAMAQQFTDWYYAITTAQLGAHAGQAPLQRACAAFAQGIVNVTRTADLVDWAHGVVAEEISAAGGRIEGGDFPNAITGQRPPTELLRQARERMPADQVELLQATYSKAVRTDELTELAERHGGWPYAVLTARHALKMWLRDQSGVGFSVVPDEPNLDMGPLPLYEAGRMANADEESFFEKWLVSDIDLCRDVAEFANFAHALRAGAFDAPAPVARLEPEVANRPLSSAPPVDPAFVDDETGPSLLSIGAAVAGVMVVLALIVVILFFYLK